MSNSLASVHPELISEWSEKNLPLTPDADRVKAVFKSVHIFIYSDVEADVSVIRAKFNEWRKRL